MTLTRWQTPKQTWSFTPFRRAGGLQNEIEQIFDQAFGPLFGSRTQPELTGGWIPAVDLYEGKDSLTVKCELPGLKKDDIGISLQNGFLTISGERKNEVKVQEGEVYRTERYEGRFNRSLALPSKVDAEKINATYKDGVLTITLPKAEEAKPKQVKVNFN